MNKTFIDVSTGEAFRLLNKRQDLVGEEPIKMRSIQSNEIKTVYPDNLLEVTSTLAQLMRAQFEYPYQFSDVTWNMEINRPFNKKTVLLKDINPYFKRRRERDDAILKIEIEKRISLEAREDNYIVLKDQNADIINMWLRMNGYDLGVMKNLANTSQHFAEIMRNDNIWMNALEFHYPYVSTHFMGPISRTIHPWVREMLDTITTDPTHRGQRYPKRLMELRQRFNLRTTVKMPVVIPNNPFQGPGDKRKHLTTNKSQTKWLSHIWQCGENIYGLFSETQADARRHIGRYLVHWDARQEQPFVSPFTKHNLIHYQTERVRLVDFDQDGFIMVMSKITQEDSVIRLVYISGFNTPGVRKVILLNNLPDSAFTLGKFLVWMTPSMIITPHMIYTRTPDNYIILESQIILEEGLEVVAVVGYNTTIIRRQDQGEYFLAFDMLNPKGYTKGRVISQTEFDTYQESIGSVPRLGMGMGGIMFHWHDIENRMACFDYSELKIDRSEIIYYLPNITLTADPIGFQCVTCNKEAKVKERDDAEKPFCGTQCQKAHHQ